MARLASSGLSSTEEDARKGNKGNIPFVYGQVTIANGAKISKPMTGLIDTGAARTLIPQSVVASLKLVPDGHARLTTADGRTQTYTTYWVQISVTDVRPRHLKVAASDRSDVLIGRDLLQYCRLTYDGRVGGVSLYEQSIIGVVFSRLHFKTLRLRDALIGVMRRR